MTKKLKALISDEPTNALSTICWNSLAFHLMLVRVKRCDFCWVVDTSLVGYRVSCGAEHKLFSTLILICSAGSQSHRSIFSDELMKTRQPYLGPKVRAPSNATVGQIMFKFDLWCIYFILAQKEFWTTSSPSCTFCSRHTCTLCSLCCTFLLLLLCLLIRFSQNQVTALHLVRTRLQSL